MGEIMILDLDSNQVRLNPPTDLSALTSRQTTPFLPLMIFAPKDQHPRVFPLAGVNLSVAEFGHGTKCNYGW